MSVHVQSNVWRSCPQAHDRLLLMVALAEWCNDDGYCWPSLATMAKRVRLTKRGVIRMLSALIEEGEVILVKKGGNGAGDKSVYLLERYSEGGMCTTFGKGDLEAIKGDPDAKKGCKLTEQSVPEPKRTTNRTVSTAAEAVDNIYAAYPRKVAKPKAIAAIAKASMKTPLDKLFALTKAYAAAVAGSDEQFIPYPATWFNQERYNDDPKTWKRTEGKNGKGPRPKAATDDDFRNAEF